ncbi:MAG: glycosyltransferase family A protein [Thermoanaerobaculia bacterium]
MTAISVVMGVYNGAATLGATIDSILAQTERDLELIVVDDGSTDDTPRILARYANHDSRVRIVTVQHHGLTRALIAGCAAARGPLIARHDAGDLSHPRRFEMQKSLFDRHADVVLASCWTQFAGPELEPLSVMRGSGLALEPIDIIDPHAEHGVIDGPTHHGSVMFRRDAYERAGGYRAAFRFGQDWDLWYRLAALGRYMTVAEVLYTARTTPESISSGNQRSQKMLAELSREALAARSNGQSDEDVLERAAQIGATAGHPRNARARGLHFIGEALRRNGDQRARRYLREAIAASPFSIRSWIRYLQSLRLR